MSAQKLSAFEKQVVAGLAYKAGLAASLFDAWGNLLENSAQTEKTLIDMAQLGVTEEAAAHEVLAMSVELGIIEAVPAGYLPLNGVRGRFKRLAFALNAIDHYISTVHRDETIARVVLTKPPKPSKLEQKLSEYGWKTSDLEQTDHAFQSMVRTAEKRVVVMTPFFDVKGALWLKELFSLVQPGVERILILRSLDAPNRNDYPQGYDSISIWLKDNSIRVFNYSIPKIEGKGRETFHAKAVLCDHNAAYIGSSNMTVASLEHSMEMGVAVRGRAATDAAVVLDAVISAAVEWTQEIS